MRRCKNKCIFCFIDQMPQGLRPSLYIKDDDYMQSFLHGNFITLTNLDDKDIGEIISHKIEPLHISVHSLDPEIRKRIFGINDHMRSLEYLKILDNAGLHANIQIVILPGINDGEDLENTITGLLTGYKNIYSIGIVPVGITRYNKNKELMPVDKKIAEQIFLQLEKLIKNHGKDISDKVFLSDEFYLISGKELPSYESYKDFFQINNGIGKSIDFLNDINVYLKGKKIIKNTSRPGKKILIISSQYGAMIIKKAIDVLDHHLKDNTARSRNVSFDILTIKNTFFGGNVKVTGLLTGSDLSNNIDRKEIKDYASVLIPDSIFNDNGLTLDGYKQDDIDSIGENIIIIPEDGINFINAIEKIVQDKQEF